jgi:hypothetical protein
MPNTTIETRSGWIAETPAVINAVQSALREALQLPEWDRTVRLIEHQPSHFACPPGKGPRYTLVEVTMFAGRSMDAKRSLYKAIVRSLHSESPRAISRLPCSKCRRRTGVFAVASQHLKFLSDLKSTCSAALRPSLRLTFEQYRGSSSHRS